MIEESDVFTNHPSSITFAEQQDMVQTFAPNTAQEPFTKSICSRSLEGCVEQFDLGTSDSSFK
jgi:hypothetical protein